MSNIYLTNRENKVNYIDILILLYLCFTFSILYTYKNVVAVLLICAMLFHVIRHGKIRIPFYMIWSIGFAVICFLSLMWSQSFSTSLNTAKGFLEIVIIGSLFLSQVYDKKKAEFYTKAVVLAGLCLMIRVLVEFPIASWGMVRLHNASLNSNSIGLLLAVSTLCAYHLYKITTKKVYLIAAFPFIITILFTGSRKAFIGIALGLVFLWWLHIENKTKKIAMIPLAFIAILVLFYLALNIPSLYNVIGYRIEGFFNIFGDAVITDMSIIQRSEMINVGYKLFLQSPLFGHGVDSYSSISGFGTYSHNNYIELLSDIGLIGTLWYYSIYIYNIKRIIKIVRLKDRQVNLFACFFLIQIIWEFASVSWSSEYVHIMIMFSTGYVDAFLCKSNSKSIRI